MNDSIDLRKRILKMRQINNLDNIDIDTFNSKKQDTILTKKIDKSSIESNLSNFKNNKTLNKKTNISPDLESLKLVSNNTKQNYINYDAQFRVLANKFNEAVEVILELSNKVDELEKEVYSKNKRFKKISKNISFPYIKIIVLILIISVFAYGFIYFPFSISIFKLILGDISSLV